MAVHTERAEREVRRLALVLLGLGVIAAAQAESVVPLPQRYGIKFRCANGRIVDVVRKCDGSVDCLDGSDESPVTCRAPNMTVVVGDKLAMRVQLRREHGAVWLTLCDGRSCGTLSVSGTAPDGSLAYMAYTGCNKMGDQCEMLHREEMHFGWTPFPPGGLVFEVERRPSELALWLQGRPEHWAAVPARREDTLLRVRPLYWGDEMDVRFSDLALLSGRALWCDNNGPNLDVKCYCAQGCSESACTVPHTILNVGDRRTVRVHYKDTHWAVWFLMCNDCSCSRLSVSGYSADGQLTHWPSTICNNLGLHCADLGREVRPRSPDSFLSTGELVFEVEKRDRELSVWLRGHPEHRATLPAKDTNVIFKVRPLHWTSSMPVDFLEHDADLWGRRPFTCSNGQRVEGMAKCDGVTHCTDGSDEAVALCDSEVTASTLAVGDSRTVRLQFRQEHWAVWFLLCDEIKCRTISVSGVRPDGSLDYWSYSGCNRMGDHCETLLHKSKPGGSPFLSGELTFEVERLEHDVVVRLDGPNRRATARASVPTPEYSMVLLKVRPLILRDNGNMAVRITDRFTSFQSVNGI